MFLQIIELFLLLLAICNYDYIGASSTTGVTKVTNEQQNNKTGVINYLSDFTCQWAMYPDVKMIFEVPEHWAEQFRKINLTDETREKSGLDIWVLPYDVNKYKFGGYTPKWEKMERCNRMGLIWNTRSIVCLISYVSPLVQYKVAYHYRYYKFKLVYNTEHLNQTVHQFIKFPERFSNRTVIARNPFVSQEEVSYDFSSNDVFRCLGDIRPELVATGSCNSLTLYWYTSPELFTYQFIHADNLVVRRREDSQLITIHKNSYLPETSKYLDVFNITDLIVSDTWYVACVEMTFLPGWLDSKLYNLTDDNYLVICKSAYTTCNTERTTAKKFFLTIEWTTSILIILAFFIIILLVVISVQYKRNGCFAHARDGDDENYLIQPVEQRTLIGENEAHFMDGQPYTYIDHAGCQNVPQNTIQTSEQHRNAAQMQTVSYID